MNLQERCRAAKNSDPWKVFSKEWERLAIYRQQEALAELPVPLCCPMAAGNNSITALYNEDTGIRWWLFEDSFEVFPVLFCPFCGTKLPELQEKAVKPPYIVKSTEGGLCTTCNVSCVYCSCSHEESRWEVKDAPPIFAATALVAQDSKVLSVSRKNNHSDKGLPGGRIEPNETPAEAMCRELLEETGLKALEYHLVFDAMDSQGYRCVTFRVTKFEGTIDTQEKGLVEWLDPSEMTGPSLSFGLFNQALFNRTLDL